MKLHEYQAKEIFRRYHIRVPAGEVAGSVDKVIESARNINGPPWVVKAQVHAGGRGKAGGVRIADSLEQLKQAAKEILGRPLISEQTGPEGKRVTKLLIEEAVEIERELYLAMTIDRSKAEPVIIFSQVGGMDIEEVARVSPEQLMNEHIPFDMGWSPFVAKKLAYGLDPLPGPNTLKELTNIISRLYTVFMELDCSLAEINPLVTTKKGDVIALDAKINIDDNALFRRKAMADLDDPLEKEHLEREAAKYHLNYIKLDGNIGAMVNGAGLAMATMDLIKMAGAEPANFLDVGGGASEEMVTKGLEIILMDEKVKAIFINIFGGILRCDVLARGVLAAAEKTHIKVPVIVRLEGTNVEDGRKILEESDLKFMVAKDMNEAADLVTRAVSITV
ncbi:MAG: ADP-forming succinate--CoA ligase subunit beta [Deltaproteobacteria bacterium]|nr:ADP-forming succinate--CoA ligase subunit beta [Deltaproteobacteria bacterium]